MSKAGELDMRVSNMEGEIKRSRDATQRLESTFARLEEVADRLIRMIEAKFARNSSSPEDGGSNFLNIPEVKFDRPEDPWLTRENHQQEASQKGKELENRKIGEESSGVITQERKPEGTKEREIEPSRSSDRQESFTVFDFDWSPPKESDRNFDGVLPGDHHDRAGGKRQEPDVKVGPEFEHLGPPPWSRERRDESEVDRRKTEPGVTDVLQIGDSTGEKDKKVGMEMEEMKLEVVDHGDCWLNREERAREFEKAVLKAAREVGSEYAIWLVGFDFFEPVFLLVRGKEFPEPVGSPLWFDDTGNGFESGRWEMKQKCVGPSLKSLGPSIWPNISLINFQRVDGKPRSTGPIFLQVNDELKGKYEEEVIGHLLPPDFACHSTRLSFKSPPPNKPPPRPPDSPSDCLRLELISTTSICPVAHGPISLHVKGKVDAASGDPGDCRFHQFSTSWDSNFDFTHSLEDKADFKGSVRALIRTREGCLVENCRFELPRPPEPPLSWVSPCGVATMKCNDPVVAQWLEEPIPMALRMDYVTSLEVKALLDTWANARKSAHCWIGDRKEAASIDPGDSLLAYSTEAVISVYVEIILEGEVSKLAYQGCRIQEDSDKNNLMLQLVYHSPRPPEFETNEVNPLSDRNRNKLIMDNFRQVQQGIKLEMFTEWWQGICSLKGRNSRDQGHLKLNTQADFKMINGQLTHPS